MEGTDVRQPKMPPGMLRIYFLSSMQSLIHLLIILPGD